MRWIVLVALFNIFSNSIIKEREIDICLNIFKSSYEWINAEIFVGPRGGVGGGLEEVLMPIFGKLYELKKLNFPRELGLEPHN